MAGASPEEAVDAFVHRVRSSLDCILSGTAFGSGNAVGVAQRVTLYTLGQTESNIARLSTHAGEGELLFRFAHLYTVVHLPDDAQHGPYNVSTSFYQYRILDLNENEIVVYDWAPTGISPIRTPHLHLPAARTIILSQRPGSRLEQHKTYLGDLHFPTGRIHLEDIVEFPIREFQTDTLRDDWEEVLRANREAQNRGWTR